MCMCVRASVCEWSVCGHVGSDTENDQNSGRAYFQKKPQSLAATKPVPCPATVRQHDTTAAVLQAHALVPVVTVYVCGWCTAGDRTTTILSRPMQQSTATSSNLMPGIPSIKQEHKQHLLSYQVHINGTPVFTLFDLRRLRDIKPPPPRRRTS